MPFVGIELTTYRLQGGCSTTELNRLALYFKPRNLTPLNPKTEIGPNGSASIDASQRALVQRHPVASGKLFYSL